MGVVGRTRAEKLIELGHGLVVGTRDGKVTLSRIKEGEMGILPCAHGLVIMKMLA
jgi:hypothetical protein